MADATGSDQKMAEDRKRKLERQEILEQEFATMYDLCRDGNLDELKQLYPVMYEKYKNVWKLYWADTAAAAARHGQMATLEFLFTRDPPCPVNEEVYLNAIHGGSLDILKLVFENDERNIEAKISGNATQLMASQGNLVMLQWAEQHGALWDQEICKAADCPENRHIKEWIQTLPEDRRPCGIMAWLLDGKELKRWFPETKECRCVTNPLKAGAD